MMVDPRDVNPMSYPYSSRRTVVYGRRGMVATSQPLAAQAGLEVLQRGGNAMDAAVATAAALTVVEPTSNGLGGDAFALVWADGKLHGLNASGPAPKGLTHEWIRNHGFEAMPAHGWGSVTVPGAPAAWQAVTRRFGQLSLEENLRPAIRLAEEGYPVSPTLAYFWGRAHTRYSEILTDPEYQEWFRVFAPGGRTPGAGEVFYAPDHARTLKRLAQTDGEAYYRGEIAEAISTFARATGGVMTVDDLASFQPEWVTPLSVSYRGYDVWELPPNGQGLVALMALKMLGLVTALDEEERIHQQIEALKLGFADAFRYVADPSHMPWPVESLLQDGYIRQRAALIGDQALARTAGRPVPGGTVYLCTADDRGNMVSFIQSNYAGFGSGLVVPGTGIALQNRGHLFSLEEGHPNLLEPGKRPFHTIIPGFVTRNGKPMGPFGVMGGYMQPQGHVQVMANVLDRALNPQAALDAPRFYWAVDNQVKVEAHMPEAIVAGLRRRGHEVEVVPEFGPFGRGEIIWRRDDGVLMGATEPRADGQVAVW